MRDNIQPPDQEELERAIRDLFKDGDIRETSRHSRIPYGTLTKQLNPNDVTESTTYEFLMLLYGAEKARPGLGEALWVLVSAYRQKMLARAKGEGGDLGDALEACGNFVAVAARREEGMRTPEEFEAARQSVLETVEKVTVYPASAHLGNVG